VWVGTIVVCIVSPPPYTPTLHHDVTSGSSGSFKHILYSPVPRVYHARFTPILDIHAGMNAFYPFIFTQILSLIGSRMTGVAIGIQIFTDTGAAAPLLIAAFFAELPGMLGSSLTGAIADRWDRRRVIMLADAGQAVATSLLLVSFASGQFQLWHLYTMMLLMGIFGTLQSPASQAALTMLVPKNQRDRANGIRETGFPLAGVIAPALTGLLFTVVGVTGIMLLDLLTFVIAISVVSRLNIPNPRRSADAAASGESWWRSTLGGWRFLWQQRALLGVAAYLSFYTSSSTARWTWRRRISSR
jgi:MFS transporter, DHA3 family, macrolide efflux protein